MGRGLNTRLAAAAEGTWGTYQTPSRHYEINSETLEAEYGVVRSDSLRASGRYPRQRGKRSMIGAGGGIEMELATSNMGLWWANTLGGTPVVAQQGATAAYKQTHKFGSLNGKSLTIQKGIEESAGDYKPFSYIGSKILSMNVKVSVEGLAVVTFTIDAKEEVDSEAIVAASYPVRNVYSFMDAAVKVDGAAVGAVTDADFTITNNLKTDSRYLGSDGRKAQQTDDDFPSMEGTLGVEFEDKTVFYDRFADDASAELIIELVGEVIEAPYSETFRVTFSDIRFTGETPKASGPGVIQTSVPFEGSYNGTDEPLILEYISTDTAI